MMFNWRDVEPVLIDGGFSLQLQSHVNENIDGHPLWTARFLLTHSNAVIATHKDFLRAGCRIVRTNTYQANLPGLVKYLNISEQQAKTLIQDSVEMVKVAMEQENIVEKILIAGSIGPYGASLHDGSEYTGGYEETMSEKDFIDWHRPRIQALIKAGCQLLAIETIPCSKEALAILKLLEEYPNVLAWLSFTAKDGVRISNGELFDEVVSKCWNSGGNKQIIAVGVNCVHPELVSSLLKKARDKNANVPFVVYPNSGEIFNKGSNKWEATTALKPLSCFVKQWLDLGVVLIGTCCRTTTQDLIAIKKELIAWIDEKKPTLSQNPLLK